MVRTEISSKIWRGLDPYYGFPSSSYQSDAQGWGQQHQYLTESIPRSGECVIVEVGVWKGASTIKMAQMLQNNALDGCVIAVDTWLGAVDHWVQDKWFQELGFAFGFPTIQRKFMKNVIEAGVQDFVVPLPLDSINASSLLYNLGISADFIHLDAGHEYKSVLSDLEAWWPRLRKGGLLIGDDYQMTGGWPGVKQAFDEFFATLGVSSIENIDGKCRIRKS